MHIYGHVRGRSTALFGIFPGYGKAKKKKNGRHWQIGVQPVLATGTGKVGDSMIKEFIHGDTIMGDTGTHP